MFERFMPGRREENFQKEVQEKQFKFEREQNVFNTSAKEEMIDLQQQENRSDLIKWQQEMDEELLDLIYKLKGYEQTANGWIKPKVPTPLCNDIFINNIVIPQCKPYLSKNFINSNLTEDRILKMLTRTMWTITDEMSDGFDFYDIKFVNYDNVQRVIIDLIAPAAFRALNGWTKKTDSTTFKKVESSFENNAAEQRKKGLFGIA